ncbi:uncharacterized protein LOC132639432 [Lycium barbarum]|uniref:uncharacterized protein LOC132639432 n=1 Tax=Lycium barbarum TaxID=112863 RepID=UPI00293ED5E2|nr:uncharacterized protein LOC132639432 [Lycium barbarum]
MLTKEKEWQAVKKKSAARGTAMMSIGDGAEWVQRDRAEEQTSKHIQIKLITWNVRGLSKDHKQREVRKFIHENKVDLLAIVEHKVNKKHVEAIIKRIAQGWNWVANYNAQDKGRIWILWNPHVLTFTAQIIHEQFIYGVIRGQSTSFHFAAIYGLHTVESRRELWSELRNIHAGVQISLLLMGDFNAIKELEDRSSNNIVHDSDVKDFKDFLFNTGMDELPYVGSKYTWSNGHVQSKIDWSIVNTTWLLQMPPTSVIIMEPFFSDHSPLLIVVDEQSRRAPKQFKFFNYMADQEEFHETVATCLAKQVKGSALEKVWQKLKNVKHGIQGLKSTKYNGVEIKVQEYKEQLLAVQQQRINGQHPELNDTERELRKQFEKWAAIEESIARHKSRVRWLKLGDSNSTFFFTNMKNRNVQNRIHVLKASNGNLIQNPEGIEHEIGNFYQCLLGTTTPHLPDADPIIFIQGYILPRKEQLNLITPVTKEEIKQAL